MSAARLTPDQVEYLKSNYATASMAELVHNLGRSAEFIQKAANSRGLNRPVSFEAERTLKFISENPGVQRADIAVKLRKGANAIGRMLHKLHHMKLIRAEGIGRATRWHAVPEAEPVPLPKRQKTAPVAVQMVPSRWAGVSSIFGAAA